jgi:uncharacterized protein with PhoU and TrkA domain
MMHRTQSVDYAIVISGEIWALMDTGETKMNAGDILIQRGTIMLGQTVRASRALWLSY